MLGDYYTEGSWFSGGQHSIQASWGEILDLIKTVQPDQLWIGTDSHLKQHDFIFATALVICKESETQSERLRLYYVHRSRVPLKHYKDHLASGLRRRLSDEVQRSVDLALGVEAETGLKAIVHVDVNASEVHKSGKYAKQLSNYVKGCGFEVEIKPDAWASSGVADKHSK